MAATVVAAELDRAGLAGRVVVDSAGTGNWHQGEPMDPRARAELSRRGYDGSAHRARQINRSWLSRYDLILAMDHSNLRNLELMAAGQPGAAGRVALLRSFDPAADAQAQVPDPYDGADSGFATVFEIVAAAARGLARQLASHLGKPGQPAGPQPAGPLPAGG